MNLNVIHAVLAGPELRAVRAGLEQGPWLDGRRTAGPEAARTKHNLQLEPGSRAHVELSEVVKRAFVANEAFKQLALPRRISAPLFSRYDTGMAYGPHTDDAYRAQEALRTDLAVTLFLSEPTDYDGGALTVGDAEIRAAAGDAVVYPATTIHRVSQVTRGTRLACVFWVQSLIRDEAKRDILLTLQNVAARVAGDAPTSLALSRVQQNLLRIWLD